MDKYGVVIDPEKTKTASSMKNCPRCGHELKQVSFCEVCGTEPFEKKPDVPQTPSK